MLLPSEVIVDEKAEKIIAEGRDGHFCLKPRHTSFVSALAPGILSFVPKGGKEKYMAVDEGVLVKKDEEVTVSVRDAVMGDDLEKLRETVETRFKHLDEHEKIARSALARLEAGAVRKFMEMGKAEYE